MWRQVKQLQQAQSEGSGGPPGVRRGTPGGASEGGERAVFEKQLDLNLEELHRVGPPCLTKFDNISIKF